MAADAAPNIELPPELRPADGRFGSGPSKVRSEAVAALAAAAPTYLGTSHRQAGVRSVVHRLRQGMAELFSLPDGYEVVLGNCGPTALRVAPAQFDVSYFAPQKGFSSDGGLWVALCSPAAVDRIERIGESGRWQPPSLSLPIALENSRLDQTYNTPALATLFLMVHQVEWINGNGGLAWSPARCDQSADIVYGWAQASDWARPFVADQV